MVVRSNEPFPLYVCRIDRQTSGLVLLARSQSVASHLTNHFVKRSVRKEYLARVKVQHYSISV